MRRRASVKFFALLVYSIDGEDEALVGEHEVDVVLIDHAPDIIEPARHALDRLLEQFGPPGTVLNKGALCIPVKLVEEGVDLALLGAEVKDGDAGMAPLHFGGASQHLLAPGFGGLVKEGYELLLNNDVLDVRGECVVYRGEPVNMDSSATETWGIIGIGVDIPRAW